MEHTGDLTPGYVVPEHYFVTEEVWITVGPSAGQCNGPHSAYPRLRHFYDKLIDSTKWQAEIGVEGSVAPKGVARMTYGKSNQNEFPPVSVEIKPVSIGNGRMQDFEWRYKAVSSSSETHMEFSTSNPAVHRITYTIDCDDIAALPNNFKVSIRAVFRADRKARRVSSSLPSLDSSAIAT